MKWMFANHPKMAKRWAEHTPDQSALPDKKRKAKRVGKAKAK